MSFKSIQGRLSFLFLAFAVLVLVSVGVTFWGLNAQKVDGVVINLAGRQRMLVQQMTLLALKIENQGLEGHLEKLVESQATFVSTLSALRDGGQAPYLPGRNVELPRTTSPDILRQIDQVDESWDTYRAQLNQVKSTPPNSQEFTRAVQAVQKTAPALVKQMDSVVRLYEAQSAARVTRLRWVQVGFLFSALGLLVIGVWVTRLSIITPLQDLGSAARRIGLGDIETPVQVDGDVEIDVLSTTMEDMRSKLLVSQHELKDWANTLEERVAQRTQELEALNAVSREIGSRLNLNHVLNSVVKKTRQLLKADVAYLCLLDERESSLSLQSTSGPPEAILACDASADEQWASRIIASEDPVRCDVDACQDFCQIVARPYRHSHLAAPLNIENHVIGALCVASQSPDFLSEDAAYLLSRLANIASIAMENARLYAQLERSSALEERHRIAAEIHDGLAQTLSFLLISTDHARDELEAGDVLHAKQTLSSVERGVNQASVDIRRAIDSLHDEFPAQYTLQEQISSMIQEVDSGDQRVVWQNKANIPLVLAHQNSEQVLRVVREALINALKHSQATQISVNLERANGSAVVSVQDNGIGFDPQTRPDQDDRLHFGLKIMHARAARLGGELKIHSVSGEGACIELSWPLEDERNYD